MSYIGDTPILVLDGGTGRATLDANGLLVGAGTSNVVSLSVGASNTVLVGNTGADPSFSGTPQVTSINFGQNDLDTYENGTFTPGIALGGGTTGITYGTPRSGTYTRIGRVVFMTLQVTLTSKGTDVGLLTITGLPFNSAVSVWMTCAMANVSITGNEYMVAKTHTANTMLIQETDNGSAIDNLRDTDISDNSQFNISGFYFV